MKYCSRCGKQLVDEAVVCIGCGCAVAPAAAVKAPAPVAEESGLALAAKIFMVIGTVVMGVGIIPLAWCIPMTVSYFKKVNSGQPVGVGFKICSLLFVSLIGGILMLCDDD